MGTMVIAKNKYPLSRIAGSCRARVKTAALCAIVTVSLASAAIAQPVAVSTPKGRVDVSAIVEASPSGPAFLVEVNNKTLFVWDYLTLRFTPEGRKPFESVVYLLWDRSRRISHLPIELAASAIGKPVAVQFVDGVAVDPLEKRRALVRLECAGWPVDGAIESMKAADGDLALEVYKQAWSEGCQHLPRPSAPPDRLAYPLEMFSKIVTGMPFDRVVAIAGPGQEVSRFSLPGIETTSYSWTNSDGSGMSVIFQNGKVAGKSQFGLR